MKKNRLFIFKTMIVMIVAVFTFVSVHAQSAKDEKKVIKVMVMADVDGDISIDTTIMLDDDFDGDWKALVDDEELLKELEDININLEMDEAGGVHIMSSEISGRKYIYVTDSAADCKHKHHAKGKNITISKKMDVNVEVKDGDTIMTYTIETEGGDDAQTNVMVLTSDNEEEMKHDILLKKIHGDSCKIIIVTTGDDDEAVKLVKQKEVIIITEDDDQDKKKKKKDRKK
ncbi:MAG: hypothetical protein ABFS05_11645 [Bacteroidota bacterium]